jgi:acyl-CoA thioesterase-1
MMFFGSASGMAKTIQLVAFGDSLTAGYLLPQDQALPVVIERMLKAKGFDIAVINGGVSGDTTADGLARLDWTIPDGTDGVILALGANDMLRGLDPAIPRANLTAMMQRLKDRQIAVLLVGMRAPANYGAAYVEAFDGIYPDLAARFGAPLYSFLLAGVAGKPDLLLTDGLHPNPAGVDLIATKMMPLIEAFVAKLR